MDAIVTQILIKLENKLTFIHTNVHIILGTPTTDALKALAAMSNLLPITFNKKLIMTRITRTSRHRVW